MAGPLSRRFFMFALALLTLACTASFAEPPVLQRDTPVTGASWPSEGRAFEFIVIGDRRGGGEGEWPLFDQAMDEVNLLRPDFAITIGDHIEGYNPNLEVIGAQWKDYREHADRLDVPLFLLPGNHDVSNPAMLQYWKENIGRTYYSFDYKGAHFLVLNSYEHFHENNAHLGEEQLAFALEDLANTQNATHTFVLMHHPIWQYPNNADWQKVEEALANRPHTVFAGHTHTLTFEQRNDARYIIVSTTRGFGPSDPTNRITELGVFPLYTLVTVGGDEPRIVHIEPGGAIWPEDVATRAFQQAARSVLSVQALAPEGLETAEARAGIAADIKNDLPKPIDVTVKVLPPDEAAWKAVGEGFERTVTVPAGESQTVQTLLAVAPDKLVPAPRLQTSVKYDGKTLQSGTRTMPLFPDAALRDAPEWQIVGPFDAGDVPRDVPENPAEAMPKVMAERGPEKGFSQGATFDADGAARSWQTAKDANGVDLGALAKPSNNMLGYGACEVVSPAAKIVYAEFRADDFAQIFVNGGALENGRLFRTASGSTWVALPLTEGRNSIVVKCANISGGWSFRLRFADPEKALELAAP